MEKKKDFHIHEILFLVNTADCIPASRSRFLYEKDCLTLLLHAITAFIHFNFILRSDVFDKLDIPSLSLLSFKFQFTGPASVSLGACFSVAAEV